MKHIKCDSEMKELIKFLQVIPENIINASLEKLVFINRTERRKYDKCKTLNERLWFVINGVHRCSLIENINNILNTNIDMQPESTFDEILLNFNHHNNINYTVYMFHRCCDVDFDEKYFSKFIESEQFIKTVTNSWVIEDNIAINERSNKIEIKNQTASINKMEEHKMNCYLGRIELKGTFYNFRPQFLLDEQGVCSEISKLQLEEGFPINGTLNLAYKMYGKSQSILEELNIDRSSDESYPHKGIYAMSFSDNELTMNENNKIQLKLDLQQMNDDGVNLKDRILSLNKVGVYKIATPQNYTHIKEMFNVIIPINEDLDSNEDVVLDINDGRLYGPYNINERSIDGMKYIKPDASSNKYIIKSYTEFSKFEIEKQSYMKDPIYTHLAKIYMKSEEDVDVIPDSMLLNKLQDNINIDLMFEDSEEFERLCSNSPFLGDIPDNMRKTRFNKIKSIIQNTVSFGNEKREAIVSLINNSGDEIQNLLGEKIEESSAYRDRIQEIDTLKKENEDLTMQIEELNTEIRNLETKNQEFALKISSATEGDSSIIEEERTKAENEFNELRQRHEELNSQVDELLKKQKVGNELSKLYEEQKRLKNINGYLQEEATKLEGKKVNLQAEVKEAISKGVADTAQNAFDPFISNAMIEAAGQWRSKIEDDEYKLIAERMTGYSYNKIEKGILIDKLVADIKKFRNYSKNDIINIFICTSQSFLTIFSGEPGTGKTSICNILANSLGLNIFGNSKDTGISMNRYVPVSVERGWSSKRDLIGYYNPLTKKYDRSNVKIYDALMILNQEREDSQFPYIVLLDEANLSPMEYYWADFMRVTDRFQDNTFINIGLDMDVYIPKTLRFLATINNDQTTEQLSPRLIDRAWIVKLPKCDFKEKLDNVSYSFDKAVCWSNIESTFINSESKEIQLKTPVEQIYKLFDDNHLTVSPRVQQNIKNYICVAQEIMEDELGVTKKEKALDFAIVQKLLPKINGYYSNYERLFNSLLLICEENHLKMTKAALNSMQEYQEQNMGYCQFLM